MSNRQLIKEKPTKWILVVIILILLNYFKGNLSNICRFFVSSRIMSITRGGKSRISYLLIKLKLKGDNKLLEGRGGKRSVSQFIRLNCDFCFVSQNMTGRGALRSGRPV